MRILRSFFILLAFLVATSFFIKVSNAANDISISPGFVNLSAGESFDLTIRNNTNANQSFIIFTQLFEIDENDNFVPLGRENSVDILEQLGNNPLEINETEIEVSSNEQKNIKAKYNESIQRYFLGVGVESISSEGEEIQLQSVLSSLIIPKLGKTGIESSIQNEINVELTQVLGVTYNKGIFINTNIKNLSSTFFKPTGEVVIYDGKKRLGSISLTPQIQNYIYPNKELELNNKLNDNRNLFSRIGNLRVVQNINIDGVTFSTESIVFIFPIEFVFIAIGILALLILLFKFRKRRVGNSRLSVRK